MSAAGAVPARRKPAVTVAPAARRAGAATGSRPDGSRAKPTAAGLGVDLAALDWQRSGSSAGSFEVAFIAARRDGAADPAIDWVLLRVAGDPSGRVLVFDSTEWMCFVDGVARGEFDFPG